jgi:hypothetical protein
MEHIYEALINPNDKIILTVPYFHLFIEGFDPKNYDIRIVTKDGVPIAQELNKSGNGFTISFHTSQIVIIKKKGFMV